MGTGERLRATLRRTRELLGLLGDPAGDGETLWTERRLRLATRRYGGVDPEVVARTLPRAVLAPPAITDSPDGPDIPPAATFPRLKPSVVELATSGLGTLGRRMANLPAKAAGGASMSRSYKPSRMQPDTNQESAVGYSSAKSDETETEVFFHSSEPPVRDNSRVTGEPEAAGRSHTDRVGMSRMDPKVLPAATPGDEPDKREYGIGVVGEAFGRDFKTSLRNRPFILAQMDDMDDFRPYFTYWVTTVQIVVMLITLLLYGFGPIGIELAQSRGQVLTRGLYIEEIDFNEPASFWLGPRAADLIHLGAKFSPCMRSDQSILAEVALQAKREADTGCCIRNDHSGCMQVRQVECSSLLSTFHKWTPRGPGPDGRTSGPVCGQDPQYCIAPKSSYADTWLDDISLWPVCHVSSAPNPTHYFGLARVQRASPVPRHMTCELVARPCCIGIHGKCEVRTKEFCDFTNGHFHPEATLCSQVSCMEDVCGMLPFLHRHMPDQFYRLWTSLFLHAGLLHLAISVLLQLYLMRDMEKLCGPVRMAVIYLGSGIAGNLASAIFIPYKAESGPAGAQFGLLATLIVEVLNVWPVLRSPWVALGKLLAVVGVLFVLGTMPWIDNYAHFVGFLAGFLLAYALMPSITFSPSPGSSSRRTVLAALCFGAAALIFLVLVLVFYYTPIYDCAWCKYLTCIPFTKDFCASQNINFKKDAPIINF
jgi:membrane associated rhomboid family serine protease